MQKLADFYVPSKIQPREHSRGGGADGFLHESAGVLWTVNCNWNDDGWNVNANSVDNPNDWNDGNQVFSPKLKYFSRLFGGSFICSPFRHPPSIRPISFNRLESSAYFSVGISLFSHASCTKNLRTSSRDIIFPSIIIFCSGGRYDAVKLSSRISKNNWSIFRPKP